ncbi:uncharacterized protein EAE97_007171 [Botrytis byssoidea]|uniref:Uncharacterized protein n=1 Tax=Botrytis byssoidea TaxID=139641 RepID=A0A9P5IJY0_9HELO|nr:uncharacterized protein EAE97_007171 [Botrytis byssoidea]KAF7939090.1 hypothetical protein EAE97_007171 [Botrytis byssoidea]
MAIVRAAPAHMNAFPLIVVNLDVLAVASCSFAFEVVASIRPPKVEFTPAVLAILDTLKRRII